MSKAKEALIGKARFEYTTIHNVEFNIYTHCSFINKAPRTCIGVYTSVGRQ